MCLVPKTSSVIFHRHRIVRRGASGRMSEDYESAPMQKKELVRTNRLSRRRPTLISRLFGEIDIHGLTIICNIPSCSLLGLATVGSEVRD